MDTNQNTKGIFFIMTGMAFFSIQDSLIKFIFENQKDLQRPIFFDGKNYIVCRPPDKVLDFI